MASTSRVADPILHEWPGTPRMTACGYLLFSKSGRTCERPLDSYGGGTCKPYFTMMASQLSQPQWMQKLDLGACVWQRILGL